MYTQATHPALRFTTKNPPPYGRGFYYSSTKLVAELTELTSSGGNQERRIGEDIANGEVS